MIRSFAIGRPGLRVATFVLGFVLSATPQARGGQSSHRGNGAQTRTSDDHPRLPPGEGRDVMIRVCSQCHSPDSAADQQLGPEGWQDLVNQMVETGAEATPDEFDLIVRYLSKAFPPPKQASQRRDTLDAARRLQHAST